jgi:hypothetical protein
MMAWLLMVAGPVLVGLSFPVPGLPGSALALAGMGMCWVGYIRYRSDRNGGAR